MKPITITVMDYSDSSITIYQNVNIDPVDTDAVEKFIFQENDHRVSECYYMTTIGNLKVSYKTLN